jgi:hypothetical protein
MRSLLIALMMEAARTSETLVNFYQTTQRYNPKDSHLRTHRRENLKSYVKRKLISNYFPTGTMIGLQEEGTHTSEKWFVN